MIKRNAIESEYQDCVKSIRNFFGKDFPKPLRIDRDYEIAPTEDGGLAMTVQYHDGKGQLHMITSRLA